MDAITNKADFASEESHSDAVIAPPLESGLEKCFC
ncbi:unnamed protein product, partial [marine sediment metagenome]